MWKNTQFDLPNKKITKVEYKLKPLDNLSVRENWTMNPKTKLTKQ